MPGGLKRRFENLKGILDSLAKFKKPKFKKKISQIKVKAKIKKLHEEKALLLKELMPDTQQTITWLLGLEGELKRLIHLEAEIYAEAKQ